MLCEKRNTWRLLWEGSLGSYKGSKIRGKKCDKKEEVGEGDNVKWEGQGNI